MIDSLALPATFEPRPHRASHVQQSQQREALRRKYGPGGEGPEHHALKKYIFEHPEVLGLRPVYKQMEYRFDSGDRVDVYFRTVDGTIIVVEIEIEGQDATRIGTLQAIKYRALAAAEAGRRLLSEKTQALLVAYSIPSSVVAFAKQYEIQCHQIRPAH